MKDLLLLLGKRIHDLRMAKKWSQEEFAHVSGLHRTYIGQIERGEKNISFSNLVKVAGALGCSLSELLSGLESGTASMFDPAESAGQQPAQPFRKMRDIRSLVKRLSLQQTAIDQSIANLSQLVSPSRLTAKPERRPSARKSSKS